MVKKQKSKFYNTIFCDIRLKIENWRKNGNICDLSEKQRENICNQDNVII